MAKDKKNTSFIPYENHSIIRGYAVTEDFEDSNINLDKISNKYENYLSGLISGRAVVNQHALGKAMGTLQLLVAQERAAEISFLNEVGALAHTSLADTEDTWRALIRGFNKIFSTEAVFEKNIGILRRLNSGKSKNFKYRDITHLLQTSYLPKAIQEYLPTISKIEDINEALVLKIMKRAVELMFSSKDKISNEDDAKAIECYKEMFDALTQLSHDSAVFKNLSSLFNLNEYLNNNLDELRTINSYSKYPKFSTKQKNAAGYVYEELEAVVLGQFAKIGKITSSSGMMQLTTEVQATGKTQQKADTMFIMSEGQIDLSPMVNGQQKKDGSVRLRSIERMEQLLENIGEKKAQIVFMSDKNYLLGRGTYHSKHKGFTAEEPSLSSLDKYGAQFHIPNVKGMIEYLASAGDGMIVNDVESCMSVIEACIGNFLFDDLQIEAPTGNTNRVHLLSLSGIYMPASVYLEATLRGLRGVGNLRDDELVEATFKPGSPNPGKATKSGWDAFVSKRKSEKIHISFMAGYTQFMSALFGN